MIYLILLLLTAFSYPSQAWGPRPPQMNESWPNEEWQNHAYKMAEKMPQTVDEYYWCSQGMTQENRTHLLAGIVKFESNFNPTLEYKENFKNRFGEWVISTGLFQISYDSLRGYGFNVQTKDLHNPYLNIEASSVIAERWMKKDGVISGFDNTVVTVKHPEEYTHEEANLSSNPWRGLARYWSVFRRKQQQVRDYVSVFCQ